MTTSVEDIVLDDLELALQVAEDPALQATIAGISPIAAAFMKFMPVLGAAVKGVQTVLDASLPTSAPAAAQAVVDHLTPGQPNSPALS